jgi:hypothetical protein
MEPGALANGPTSSTAMQEHSTHGARRNKGLGNVFVAAGHRALYMGARQAGKCSQAAAAAAAYVRVSPWPGTQGLSVRLRDGYDTETVGPTTCISTTSLVRAKPKCHLSRRQPASADRHCSRLTVKRMNSQAQADALAARPLHAHAPSSRSQFLLFFSLLPGCRFFIFLFNCLCMQRP